ncbi:MAG: diacylglycerol kinase [Peptostreptococcus sp.]|nr:diacylglycerol kinase [Peptostreptococcus sp.]MBF1045281.1 diacylglycerol kinase [Peptostreptococcus sp.]MBF1050294.1 diacylglycerol kinase [Peptostreptococcus sp.]MBF1056866.1 diacylglycerol kinase [Peptostreptococcus sp.]MBF1063494.1 diacylglycerol kinase [Peptostreptococcus sp.]
MEEKKSYKPDKERLKEEKDRERYKAFKKNKDKKIKQGFTKSVNAAIDGILYTFRSERNMKLHYLACFLVLIASLFFDFSKMEFIVLLGAITLVVITEMINTAVEKTVDMVTQEYNPLAKIAKDVAAGAVLVSAIYSVGVAYILFYKKLTLLTGNLVYRIRESELHITLICIVVVLIAVVVVKAITFTGTPLKGGMPSGHAALAFAIATSITLMTERVEASSLAYLMALLVAQSRIEGKIHTFWETVAGAILGTLVAIVIFQLGLFY